MNILLGNEERMKRILTRAETTKKKKCECKSLRRIKEGFKCLNCGKSFWWTEWK